MYFAESKLIPFETGKINRSNMLSWETTVNNTILSPEESFKNLLKPYNASDLKVRIVIYCIVS